MFEKLKKSSLIQKAKRKVRRGLAGLVLGASIILLPSVYGFAEDNKPRTTQSRKVEQVYNSQSKFDWRDNGYNWITPIKKQVGDCNSCELFSSGAVIEAQAKIDSNDPSKNLDLSEDYIVSCTDVIECDKAVGSQVVGILNYIKDHGIVDNNSLSESQASQPQQICSNPDEDNLVRIRNWKSISDKSWFDYDVEKNREETKRALIEKGPLIARLFMGITKEVGDKAFIENFDEYEIYRNGLIAGGHSVAIIGYVDTGDIHTSYWICKNSWGDKWNGDGYFKVGWDWKASDGKTYDQGGILFDIPIYVETQFAPKPAGLEDVIESLQVAIGLPVSDARDFTGDGRVGMDDAVFGLQKIAGMR